MRTRSQPISPSGLKSLEDVQPRRRVTRAATRAAAVAAVADDTGSSSSDATPPAATKPTPKKAAPKRVTKPKAKKKAPVKKNTRARTEDPMDESEDGPQREPESEQRPALVETESNASGRSPMIDHNIRSVPPLSPFYDSPSRRLHSTLGGSPRQLYDDSPSRQLYGGFPSQLYDDSPSRQLYATLRAVASPFGPATAPFPEAPTLPLASGALLGFSASPHQPASASPMGLATAAFDLSSPSTPTTAAPQTASPIGLATGAFDAALASPSSHETVSPIGLATRAFDDFSTSHSTTKNRRLIAAITDADRKRAHESLDEDNADDEAPAAKRQQRMASMAARQKLLISRHKPYHERVRRRMIENSGRIDKSVFRIPQLVNQNTRDRENAAANPIRRVAHNLPLAASTPVPTSPWRPLQHILDRVKKAPSAISEMLSPSSDEAPERRPKSRKSSPPRDLPYALWPVPRPISPPRRIPHPSLLAVGPAPIAGQPVVSAPRAEQPADIDSAPRAELVAAAPAPIAGQPNPTATSESTGPFGQKRKRVIPASIPNPPGCSYGMHPDYFWYSSDDEEEEPAPKPAKRVRFDLSPLDTPSKVRARAQPSPSRSPSPPPTPTPAAPTVLSSPGRSYGFIYEAHASDSEVEREQEKWEKSLRLTQKAKKAGLKPAKKQATTPVPPPSGANSFKPRLPSGLRTLTGPSIDAHRVPSFQWPLAAELEGVPAVPPQDLFGGISLVVAR